MIGISKLYCGSIEPSDILRYGRHSAKLPSHLLQFSEDKKPVIVWNVTQKCNLACRHCYAQNTISTDDELSYKEGITLLDNLSDFGVPVILFSGGEPLVRSDIFKLIEYAVSKGLRTVLSTNGTLITTETAKILKDLHLSYVGISLDGLKEVHNQFRCNEKAYDQALAGIRACLEKGIKVGLRFTLFKKNAHQILDIFKLIQKEHIPRVCFYHLVYTGRAENLKEEDLTPAETRTAVDTIINATAKLHSIGNKVEVLTVDNHADAVYLYQRLKQEDQPRAENVYSLLQMNGGNSSGHGIGCISWNGEVHPDQFLRHYSFGNVREKSFSDIWTNPDNEMLHRFKAKKEYVGGRCGRCSFLEICGGNFRARAEAVYKDLWAEDPACYLTDREIGL